MNMKTEIERITERRACFAGHVLLSEVAFTRRGTESMAWEIGKPGGGSDFYAEIIAGADRALIVHGDIGMCCFKYGPVAPLARLNWIGYHDTCLGYVAAKARVGLAEFPVVEFGDDWAIQDILEERRRGFMERDAARAAYDYLIENGSDATWLGVVGELHRFDQDAYEMRSLGNRTSSELIMAQAAVRRCWQLVEAKRAKAA
jgi:hypothetical protein